MSFLLLLGSGRKTTFTFLKKGIKAIVVLYSWLSWFARHVLLTGSLTLCFSDFQLELQRFFSSHLFLIMGLFGDRLLFFTPTSHIAFQIHYL